MLLSSLFLVVGFVVLIKGADLLVEGASALARRLGVSDLVIGLTVVAFGTSTPELFVNVFASARGASDLAVGNVLGSNIANTLLIVGVSAILCPLTVSVGTVRKEIPLGLLAAIVLGWMANDRLIDGAAISQLGRIDGLVLLAFFSIFLYYSFSIARRTDSLDDSTPRTVGGLGRASLRVLLGLVGLTVGGKWIVDGAVALALNLGLSESAMGLTIVALGTSLPELATSAVAAYRRNVDIAVGNVVGSNIFNIFFVLGVSATLRPLPFASASNIDLGVVVVSSLLLLLAMRTGRRHAVDRWEGIVFVGSYCVYLLWILTQGGTGY